MHSGPSPHIPVREGWLARLDEPGLERDIPIIDSHHHLWDRPGNRYLPGDFQKDLESGHDIRATVYVQCRSFYRASGDEVRRPLGEVERVVQYAVEAAARPGIALGAAIIGGADLGLGDRVLPVLEEMCDVSDGRLRGIRNPTAWHRDPNIRSSPVQVEDGILRDVNWQRGAAILPRLNLSLDIWAYQTQLDDVHVLARSLPRLRVIVNHLGGPLWGNGNIDLQRQWLRGLARLAELPNVYMKLGGLGMKVAGYRFHEAESPPPSQVLAAAWREPILTAIEYFGPDRCMFESNFPVDKGMFSYGVLWNAFKRITKSYSKDEISMLFHDTAAMVYKIDV